MHYLKKRYGDSCFFSNSAFRANHSVNQMIRLLSRYVTQALVHLLTCYVTSLFSLQFSLLSGTTLGPVKTRHFGSTSCLATHTFLFFGGGWDERGTTITLRGSFGFCCAIRFTISWHDPLFICLFFLLLHFPNVAAWAVQKL